jgi:hypothetical protein
LESNGIACPVKLLRKEHLEKDLTRVTVEI